MSAVHPGAKHARWHPDRDFKSESFLLQRVQPGLSGLMDGAPSTLAPIFAVVLATHHPLTAFYTGVATALGAGVSMAFSQGLSDTGELTGRGSPRPARSYHRRRNIHRRRLPHALGHSPSSTRSILRTAPFVVALFPPRIRLPHASGGQFRGLAGGDHEHSEQGSQARSHPRTPGACTPRGPH